MDLQSPPQRSDPELLRATEAALISGDIDHAASLAKRAIEEMPRNPRAFFLAALSAHEAGTIQEAILYYQRALSLGDHSANIHYNLGLAFQQQRLYAEAVENYEIAVESAPDRIDAWENLGVAYAHIDKLEKALEALGRAKVLAPAKATVHSNLADVLRQAGRMEEALESAQKAIDIAPTLASAYHNLAFILYRLGDSERAYSALQQTLALAPKNQAARSAFLQTLNYLPGLSRSFLYREHLEFDAKFPVQALTIPKFPSPPQTTKIRVGYLSPDLRKHAVAHFMRPLLREHDREKFDIFCYFCGSREDDVSAEFKKLPLTWRNVATLSDADAARAIENDHIDVLVDLAGHTSHNRIGIFQFRPAPVQVSYLGYPNTAGISQIDYRFSDFISDPTDEDDHYYSEKLYRLPNGFLCYEPIAEAPAVGTPPVFENGYITFGSFNNLAKVTRETVALWSTVLHRTPGSRMVLKCPALSFAPARQRIQDWFSDAGIKAARLTLLGTVPKTYDHMACYQNIDIALDTSPYNGTTTTFEALWMGVPVVSKSGNRHVSRVGASILHHAGLSQWIAKDDDEFLATVDKLAADTEHLRSLRTTLRDTLCTSTLCNPKALTREIERAYAKWCHRQSADEKPGSSTLESVRTENGTNLMITRDVADGALGRYFTPRRWSSWRGEFLGKATTTGMTVIDLTPGIGVELACILPSTRPNGQCIVVPDEASDINCLTATARANPGSTLKIFGDPSQSIPDLDELPRIDLITCALASHEYGFINSSIELIEKHKPSFFFRIPRSELFNAMTILLTPLDYTAFRLMPGIGVAAPVTDEDFEFPADIIFIHHRRLGAWRDRNLLTSVYSAAANRLGATLSHWHKWCESNAFGKYFSDDVTLPAESTDTDSENYLAALDCFGVAKNQDIAVDERASHLLAGFILLSEAVNTHPTPWRLATLARISHELGFIATAVRLLDAVDTFLNGDELLAPEEPFVPPCKLYDDIELTKPVKRWLRAAVDSARVALICE